MSKHKTDVIGLPSLAVPAELLGTRQAQSGIATLIESQAQKPPAKVEIGTCLGRMIACPSCGKPALVTHARGARTVNQVISSKFWVLAKCTGYCGNGLRRIAELVTLLPESLPVPVIKPLGTIVGHFVMCPIEDTLEDGSERVCGAKSQAQWNETLAHNIHCPVHGARPYPGDTPCELVDVTESHVARTLGAPPKVEPKKRPKHTVVKHVGPFPGGIEYYFVLTYGDGKQERINFNRAGAEIDAPASLISSGTHG